MTLSLRCSVNVEELAADNCTVNRRISLKDCVIAAVKDDLKQILVRVTPLEETGSNKKIRKSLGYHVTKLDLYKRFLNEGKATIYLPNFSVRLMLSNCPPDKLRLFLGTLRVKVNASKANLIRKPVIPDAPPTSLSLMEEISPLRLPTKSQKSKILFPCDMSIISPNRETPLPCLSSSPYCNTSSQRTSPRISTPIRTKCSAKTPRILSFSHVLSLEQANLSDKDPKSRQAQVIDLIKKGRNVFCTGGAGTGKSYLIRRIIGILPPNGTAITASTGAAANLIGGTTIHAFTGLGALLENEASSEEGNSSQWIKSLHNQLQAKPTLIARWVKLKHLIIDEISMLSARLFTRLDKIAREVRQLYGRMEGAQNLPFGGIQVILFGDFYQLPPVLPILDKQSSARFAFQSPAWTKCRFETVELIHSWRQSEDPKLARLLSAVREGKRPEWVLDVLQKCCSSLEPIPLNSKPGIIPTRLCTHRTDVDSWNRKMLDSLTGTLKTFHAQDTGNVKSHMLDSVCPAPAILNLKVGAQVMLLRNLDTSRGLVNGARGIVERFNSDNGLPDVRFFSTDLSRRSTDSQGILHNVQVERWNLHNNGVRIASRSQLPLSLAWAISIHKSQGITLDTAELALSKVFECGQAYVALSRCRTLAGLHLLDWHPEVIRADPEVIKFYKDCRETQQNSNKLAQKLCFDDSQ